MELNERPDEDVIRLLLDAVSDENVDPPPPGLRLRVLAAARRHRAPGRPPGATAPTPVECYRRTVTDLDDLLTSLEPGDWPAVVEPYGWSIQGLVGHLTAVARYLATVLGTDDFEVPAELESDHIAMSLEYVEAQSGRDPADTLAGWRQALDRVLAALGAGADLGARVTVHRLTYRLGSLLVAQSFETWIHSDDIRRALGRPLTEPDAGRMMLMTDLAVRAIPNGLRRIGRGDRSGTVGIVLTGPGGGAWIQPLGQQGPPGPPDVTIVADAIDFCRVAARRLRSVDLDATIEGDRALGEAVLEAAAAFAA